jgi:hypothetical protein
VIAATLLLIALNADADINVQIHSERPSYWHGETFTVYSYDEEKTCDLGHRTPNNEYLTIAYDAESKTAHLMVTNKNASSVKNNQTVRLALVFVNGKSVTAPWNENVEFTAVEMSNGSRALVSEGLDGSFLDAFSAHETFGVFTQKKALVGGYSLKGSSEAIRQLKNCAIRAAGINPLDPFAQ